MTLAERHTKALRKKARHGFQGYPLATVAYYGPDARKATKAAVAIVPEQGAEPAVVERWFSDTRDIRRDHGVNERILAFIRAHGATSVVMSDGIIGCPHEEGVDYPDGGVCPHCPYWAGRDRWGGEGPRRQAEGDTRSSGANPGTPSAAQGLAGPDEIAQQPCPCGSGRPFAACCASATHGDGSTAARAVSQEVAQHLQDRDFADEGELQGFLDDFIAERNRRGLDDFDGLSPEQMWRLLYQPFDSAPLDGLERRLPGDLDVPVLGLFDIIADVARERGIKLTARGNLPLKLVKAADAWLRDSGRWRVDRIGSISTERDVAAFHYVRVVAEAAGLLRKARGYLYLTRRAERLVDADDRAGLYTRLFTTYTRRFNWAYRDVFDDLPIVRDSFGFTLYLLHRHGADWRPADLFEDAFLRAFPMARDEAEANTAAIGLDPERRVRLAWRSRTLSGFAHLFDLAELASETATPPSPLDDTLFVRATPLLGHVFPHPPPG